MQWRPKICHLHQQPVRLWQPFLRKFLILNCIALPDFLFKLSQQLIRVCQGIAGVFSEISGVGKKFTGFFWQTGQKCFATDRTVERHISTNRQLHPKGSIRLDSVDIVHTLILRHNIIHCLTDMVADIYQYLVSQNVVSGRLKDAGGKVSQPSGRANSIAGFCFYQKTPFQHCFTKPMNCLFWKSYPGVNFCWRLGQFQKSGCSGRGRGKRCFSVDPYTRWLF